MKLNPDFIEKAPKDLEIIPRDDPRYHYARVISNTRFGKMPACVAYCSKVEHVQYCINYCRDHKFPFRVRSGGHQHEGMCSATDVIIIDLSKINQITDTHERPLSKKIHGSGTHLNEAWIPAGKQLGQVYEELAKFGKTIPGGGCQSVNVGGLTQGGGWGTSVRKYGLTCDSVLKIEMVLANGEFVTITKDDKKYKELFWAVRGGGGGNFGVVIRFKFELASILPVTTNFAMSWENPDDIKNVITRWAELHAEEGGIDTNLSATCTMITISKGKEEHKSVVEGRMAGKFYGPKVDLLKLLLEYFGVLAMNRIASDTFTETPKNYSEENLQNDIANELKGNLEEKLPKNQENIGLLSATATYQTQDQLQEQENIITTHSYAFNQRALIDFINPAGSMLYEQIEKGTCEKLDLTVLPSSGPRSTCDQPHPHKVSSSFPKDDVNHRELVEAIYSYLENSCYYSDVNMYMSFHCMGGKVTENAGNNAFGYAHKPYMLQIQCWWDDVSNAFTNEGRNKAYLEWVKKFREAIEIYTEGAFINFVDKTLVADIKEEDNLLKLLEIYYTKVNLDRLRKVKKEHDPSQLFKFEMSILPSED